VIGIIKKRQKYTWDSERGERIRLARKRKGLTQKQLARSIGCSQSNISLIEKGRIFNLFLAIKLMQVLGVDEDYLFNMK